MCRPYKTPKEYSEASQKSKMECFGEIKNGFHVLFWVCLSNTMQLRSKSGTLFFDYFNEIPYKLQVFQNFQFYILLNFRSKRGKQINIFDSDKRRQVHTIYKLHTFVTLIQKHFEDLKQIYKSESELKGNSINLLI